MSTQRYVHINDPGNDPPSSTDKDTADQVKRDPLLSWSIKLYNLYQQVSVDKAMIKCHGHHLYIVGTLNLTTKREFKVFVKVVSGYLPDFMVYIRRQKKALSKLS